MRLADAVAGSGRPVTGGRNGAVLAIADRAKSVAAIGVQLVKHVAHLLGGTAWPVSRAAGPRPIRDRRELAVREQRTTVVEDQCAVAQQGPALAGVGGDVAGGPPVDRVGGWAYRVVGAHDGGPFWPRGAD